MRNKTIKSKKGASYKAESFGDGNEIAIHPQAALEAATHKCLLFDSTYQIKQNAFSLVEVQIAMIVLTIGLMGIVATLQTNSRQMEAAESWCRQDNQYYIVSQSNTWMRQIDMPADLTTNPDLTAWEPNVTGEQLYEVELDSYSFDLQNSTASAQVKLKKI